MASALGGGGFRNNRPGVRSAPVTVCCYICGRQFGRSSLKFHIKSCQKLFLEREAQKPKRERRKLPTMPAPGEAKESRGDGNGFFAQTGNITAFPGADGRRKEPHGFRGGGTKGCPGGSSSSLPTTPYFSWNLAAHSRIVWRSPGSRSSMPQSSSSCPGFLPPRPGAVFVG